MKAASQLMRWLIGMALLSGVTACARFDFDKDNAQAQMLDTPQLASTLADSRPAQVADRWPETRWWQPFGDPILNQLIAAAIADSPTLKVVEARMRQSQARVDATAAELYPTIEANARFSAQRFSANSVQAKFAGEHFRQLLINPLVLRYHLDFWGRDQAALQGAIGRSLALAAELADARLILAATVAAAYFDLKAAVEKQALADRIVADRNILSKLSRVKLNHGLTGEAPLLKAEKALHEANQLAAILRAVVELQKHRLAALVGQGPDWGRTIQVHAQTALPVLSLPSDLPLKLLSRRPDLTAARLRTEAAAEEIKVARTAFYPDVNLIAFTGLHSVSLTDILLQGSSLAYSVGPSIEFPIFEGGRLRANLSYQHAAYDVAVETYNASLLRAVQEVADALSQWHELETRWREQRRILAMTEAEYALSETLLKTGLADCMTLVQARLAANRERLVLATLAAEQRKTSVNLIKALGGGYNENDASRARTDKNQ
ncbi:MAG: efflux transporter outer membrane subunit [Methylococcales bacterium]|nr:efflux transporter outer membrane subunit [Methylococcales bacterium]